MAITIRPKLGLVAEAKTEKSQTFEYWIHGDTSESNILVAFQAYLPTTFNVVKRLDDFYVEEQASGIWIGKAVYEFIRGNEPGQEDPAQIPFEFEIGSESVKLTHSLETITRQLSSLSTLADAPDFKQAVNVTSNGVEGYEMPFPTFRWSETYYQPNAIIQAGYLPSIRSLLGKTNDSTFRGFAVDEVYFDGATGRNSDKFYGYSEINYKFVAGENVTGITSPGFTAYDKKAHELVWFYYHEEEDSTAKALIKIPVSLNVERIREQTSFSTLQLPV